MHLPQLMTWGDWLEITGFDCTADNIRFERPWVFKEQSSNIPDARLTSSWQGGTERAPSACPCLTAQGE